MSHGRRWFRVCGQCDARLSLGRRHPVHTEQEAGEIRLHAFCDEYCKSAWVTENG